MKKQLIISAIVLFGLAAMNSCSKTSSPPSYAMSAKINGVAFTPANCIDDISGGNLDLLGFNGDTTSPAYPMLWISMDGSGTGTYDIGSTSTSARAVYEPSANLIYIATSGTLTISAVTATSISGTFSFSCIDSVGAVTAVTGGTFTARKD